MPPPRPFLLHGSVITASLDSDHPHTDVAEEFIRRLLRGGLAFYITGGFSYDIRHRIASLTSNQADAARLSTDLNLRFDQLLQAIRQANSVGIYYMPLGHPRISALIMEYNIFDYELASYEDVEAMAIAIHHEWPLLLADDWLYDLCKVVKQEIRELNIWWLPEYRRHID